MEEELENMAMVYSYPLDEKFVESFVKEEKQLTDSDIENDIQRLLKDNLIPYKNKLIEKWIGKETFWEPWAANDYKLFVEIYVYEINVVKAQQLIDEYLNYNGEYYLEEINEEGEENNGETSNNI